ncbi:hypothetical protein Q9Q99_17800 [Curtobacterium flaccumfaciens]|nr:hypothetical protein Q9Q99_17800 [Curtobacterium flaccumfaciens]
MLNYTESTAEVTAIDQSGKFLGPCRISLEGNFGHLFEDKGLAGRVVRITERNDAAASPELCSRHIRASDSEACGFFIDNGCLPVAYRDRQIRIHIEE